MSAIKTTLANNLGPSLRRWRVLNRVKQQALAAEIGVSQAKISRWESGRYEPEGRDLQKVTTLLRARPDSAADQALLMLVTHSRSSVHLVCDITHRLLAVSPARALDWHVPAADLMGRPLWRFASSAIQRAETKLAENGWFEATSPDIVFETELAEFSELTIPKSRIRISRLPLSDGRFARLVRNDTGILA